MSLWRRFRPDWYVLRSAFRALRRVYFTVDRPGPPYYIVRRSVSLSDHHLGDAKSTFDETIAGLGKQHFYPNWEFSYVKQGEDLNLTLPHYYEHPDVPEVWWQTHVRGWFVDDENREYVQEMLEPTAGEASYYDECELLLLKAHFETKPDDIEDPDLHIDEAGFDWDIGMARLGDDLDRCPRLTILHDPRESGGHPYLVELGIQELR